MKKTLLTLGLLLMLVLPTAALAEGEAATPTPAATPAPSARPRATLTPEEKALREEIATSRQTLKTLRTQAETLSQENKTLGQQVKTGLQAVKAGTKTPTSPERIAELLPTLKQLRDSIKATEGQVREDMQAARASIAAKDFTAAKASIDEAITVLESRIALKQQVNATLKELVGLLG
jgi:uncharacterized phage infection (PIP) family protein YhgE